MKHLLRQMLWIMVFSMLINASDVVLQYAGNQVIREQVEVALSEVLGACNRYHDARELPDAVKYHFTPDAYAGFSDLLQKARPYALEPKYQTRLLDTQDGQLEVRNIRVRVFMGETGGVPYQYLVFKLNSSAIITQVNFALQQQRYQDILAGGRSLQDVANREKILHFIELYRTAYTRKDLQFIERTLSDDALVIVGNVVQVRDKNNEYLRQSYLSDTQIRFITLQKAEYLSRLGSAFAGNDFVNIEFDQININRHPRFDQIYGVQLKQRWNASNYQDEGYLFLMMDFVAPEAPIVHVRAWQPEKFEDGSTVSIFDFDIIE